MGFRYWSAEGMQDEAGACTILLVGQCVDALCRRLLLRRPRQGSRLRSGRRLIGQRTAGGANGGTGGAGAGEGRVEEAGSGKGGARRGTDVEAGG